MVKEFGELKHVFGDFLVLGHKIKNSQIKTFMQFSDFTDTHGDEELRLNGFKHNFKQIIFKSNKRFYFFFLSEAN